MSERGIKKTNYHHGDLRRALLVAAEEELIEKGTEGFTLRSCAKRAGVSHAAPAHHFGDAAGLLSALCAEGFERFVAATKARVDAAEAVEPADRMVALGLGYIAFARANQALFRLMFSSDRPDFADAALQQAGRAAFDQLVKGVAAIAGDDPLASPEGRRKVVSTWAMVHGLSYLLQTNQLRFLQADNDAELEDELRAILSAIVR